MVSCVQFYVEILVGGSLGETQQTETQREITISTGSVILFPRFMPRYRTLQRALKLKKLPGAV